MTTSRKLITLTTVWTVLLLLTVGVVPAAARADDTSSSSSAQTCSIDPNEIDPALVEMEYVDLSDGKKKKTMVYMEPDVTTFYEGQELPASTKVVPKFNGFAGNVTFQMFGLIILRSSVIVFFRLSYMCVVVLRRTKSSSSANTNTITICNLLY